MIRLVHITGLIEGMSAFVLFCIAMPMKHIWQSIGKEEFFYIGMYHGVLWVLYAIVATIALFQRAINWKQWLVLGFFSLLPLGPIVADRWVLKKQLLKASREDESV